MMKNQNQKYLENKKGPFELYVKERVPEGMQGPIKIMYVFGTRPEAVKLGPLIRLTDKSEYFRPIVAVTGQHKELVEGVLKFFEITPDINLRVMEKNQTLNGLMAKILQNLPPMIDQYAPQLVIVQGDTTSALAAAVCAYHSKITVGHVEAGLRTYDKYNPFPEEKNRHMIATLADLHFTPTAAACDNLLCEGVRKENVFITGNTVIDALLQIASRFAGSGASSLQNRNLLTRKKKRILLTTHRRESFGAPLKNIFKAMLKLTERNPDYTVLYPVHPNPQVKNEAMKMLHGKSQIMLLEPLDYEDFVKLMVHADIILTDSGGIQEEAPSLNKPVLVLRKNTERPEGLEAGTAVLVDTDPDIIVQKTEHLLSDFNSYLSMANAPNPYGDGRSSLRILSALAHFCDIEAPEFLPLNKIEYRIDTYRKSSEAK